MDDIHESEQPPVYHEWNAVTTRCDAATVAELWPSGLPRLFALVQEFDEDGQGDDVVQEVVAYGIALPDGSATTFAARGRGYGRWLSPQSASRRLDSELLWLVGR